MRIPRTHPSNIHNEELASTHLGVNAAGIRAPAYVTPDHIDPSLLVSVPRSWNRKQYSIVEGELPFVGYDVWNAYEFSTLTNSGFPISRQVKIVYRADSPCIVESKSLKLYLNSFNMVKMGSYPAEAAQEALTAIRYDLRKLLGPTVDVDMFDAEDEEVLPIDQTRFDALDLLNTTNIEFVYNEDPTLLEASGTLSLALSAHTSALRSNCKVTHQPDWGDVFIYMRGDALPSEMSLLQYIVSLRNENHFHEEICECIYKRLFDRFKPQELMVVCLYTRRGGIDINPVRASSESLMRVFVSTLIDVRQCVKKTWRQ